MLDSLMKYADSKPPVVPGFNGRVAISGKRGPVVFIATEDHDGQIEVSLSLSLFKKPTDAHVHAFFRAMNAQPIEETITRLTRHFVVRAGTSVLQ